MIGLDGSVSEEEVVFDDPSEDDGEEELEEVVASGEVLEPFLLSFVVLVSVVEMPLSVKNDESVNLFSIFCSKFRLS